MEESTVFKCLSSFTALVRLGTDSMELGYQYHGIQRCVAKDDKPDGQPGSRNCIDQCLVRRYRSILLD
jgi:hypothetical protein